MDLTIKAGRVNKFLYEGEYLAIREIYRRAKPKMRYESLVRRARKAVSNQGQVDITTLFHVSGFPVNSRELTLNGQTKNLRQWAECAPNGITSHGLLHRIDKQGMTLEEAITKPLRVKTENIKLEKVPTDDFDVNSVSGDELRVINMVKSLEKMGFSGHDLESEVLKRCA